MYKIVVTVVALALVSGCASMTRGTKDALTIESVPPGAECTLSTGEVCKSTPCTFRLSRKSQGTATCEKGRLLGSANWTHKTAGSGAAGMAGNIILGGIIGAGIDAGTGATQDLTPNPLVVHLYEPGKEPEPEPEPPATQPVIEPEVTDDPREPQGPPEVSDDD